MQFAVGFKLQGKTGHVIVDADDALVAALKVKMQLSRLCSFKGQCELLKITVGQFQLARELDITELRCARHDGHALRLGIHPVG